MIFIMRKINKISRCANVYRADFLSGEKLNPIYHSYALCITRNEGITQDEMAKRLCINKSNVTRSLAVLEEQGYIRRENDSSDKRILHIYPTQKLLDLMPEIKQISRNWNKYLTDDISEDEINIFESVLEKICDRAERYIDERQAQDK